MYSTKNEHNAAIIIGIAIATVIAIIVFAFILFVVLPINSGISAGYAENMSMSASGYPVDPLMEKLSAVETGYYNQGMAMINGSYWK